MKPTRCKLLDKKQDLQRKKSKKNQKKKNNYTSRVGLVVNDEAAKILRMFLLASVSETFTTERIHRSSYSEHFSPFNLCLLSHISWT